MTIDTVSKKDNLNYANLRSVNMVDVYVGNLFTDVKEKRNLYQSKCFNDNVYCIGWPLTYKPSDKEQYVSAVKLKTLDEQKGFGKAMACMNKIKEGDFIWSRNSLSGKFYLGKVIGYNNQIYDFYEIDDNQWCLAVHCQWIEFDLDDVPGIIVNSFARCTVKHSSTSDSALSTYFECLYSGQKDNVKLSKQSIYDFLSPEDQEDLLGIYLQKEHKYIIYPSSNKSGTTAYEYMLAKKEDKQLKKAIVQCKMGGADIFLDAFQKYEDCNIWCVTFKGDVYYDKSKSEKYHNGELANVKVFKMGNVNRDELIQWAYKEENKFLLPSRIQKYLEICCLDN